MKTTYRCDRCFEVHDCMYGAQECCPTHVTELFACGDCDEDHGEDRAAAEGCCQEKVRCEVCSRQWSTKVLNGVAVRVAGQCNNCRPHYSPDQVWQISEAFEDVSGRLGNILSGEVR